MGVGGSKSAKLKIKGLDELAIQISRLGEATVSISKKVVYAGAEPVADEIRKRLEDNVNDISYVGKRNDNAFNVKPNYKKSSGDLLGSLGIAPPSVDRKGNINTKVGFDGYDSKGVPNALKARAMESGTSELKKRPFVRPAVNKTREKSIQAMQDKYEEEAKKIKK